MAAGVYRAMLAKGGGNGDSVLGECSACACSRYLSCWDRRWGEEEAWNMNHAPKFISKD